MLDVIFFRTETGREPVREWLSNFDEDLRLARRRRDLSKSRSE